MRTLQAAVDRITRMSPRLKALTVASMTLTADHSLRATTLERF